MKQQVNKNFLIVGGIVVAGIVLIKTLGNKLVSTAQTLNPLNNPSSDSLSKSVSLNVAWNPSYWQQFGNPPGNPPGKLLYWAQVIPAVETLKRNFSWYIPVLDISSANASEVMAAIQTAKNKAQFSQIVYQYQRAYGRSLQEDINKYLLGNMVIGNSPVLQRVVDYVDNLPV